MVVYRGKKRMGRKSWVDTAIGKRFGGLVVIGKKQESVNGRIRTLAVTLCDCGRSKLIAPMSIKRGAATSCGEQLCKRGTRTHGMSNQPEYKIWYQMKARCSNKSNNKYKDYGGRGIMVCARWNSFAMFINDMGERPDGMTLDRIDNDGPYSPENCRWASRTVQQNNRRNNYRTELGGTTLTATEWSRISLVQADAISKRIKRGWSQLAAVFLPAMRSKKPRSVTA